MKLKIWLCDNQKAMPYSSNSRLPKRIKDNLPQGAQTIFRKVYNSAEKQYSKPSKRRGKASKTQVANKVAWAAVKKKYTKKKGEWKRK
ncbi:MAG TPA: ChaB family protein [Nitrosopumilaceae archaeon]|nr:ChaB family protein [Nitrosopumilaceae archaeon]